MRIRLSTTRAGHLNTLREHTSYTQRKVMNRQLAKLFVRGKVAMARKAWQGAQVAFVRGGLKAASKFVLSLS